ncbi:MAG: nitrilase-related carbon-nitrogen hydrolase [Dehalococcoidia bacterium]
MPRIVRAGLIQASVGTEAPQELDHLKKYMIDKHVSLIEQAAGEGVEVLCLQELFYGPYFCAEQDARWYSMVERVPDGPTVKLMQELAKKHNMVMVVPVYEEAMAGVYYNTAAVLDHYFLEGNDQEKTADTPSRLVNSPL